MSYEIDASFISDEEREFLRSSEPFGALLLLFSGYQEDADELRNCPVYRKTFSSADQERIEYAISRRIWNKLVFEYVDDHVRKSLQSKNLVDLRDIEPLTRGETKLIFCILDSLSQVFEKKKLPDLFSIFEVSFRDANFIYENCFDGYVFHHLSFKDCIFDAECSIEGAVVLNSLTIDGCRFNGDFSLDGLVFPKLSGVLSVSSEFRAITLFSGMSIGCDADFSDSMFFGNVVFSGSCFSSRALFLNSKFLNSTDFRAVRFERDAPHFFGSEVHEDTDFSDVEWPRGGKGVDYKQNVRCFERLKLIMGSQGKFRQEHEFLRLEMKSFEASAGFWRSIPSRLYRISSNYGWSYTRPVCWMLFIFFYGFVGLSYSLCDFEASVQVDLVGCFEKSLLLSFSNIFSFLGLGRNILFDEYSLLNNSLSAELISISQLLLGPIYLFFLGLAFRNRFRMK